MSEHEPNGKATAGLIIQALGVLLFVVTPLVVMYAKINTLETTLTERLAEVETQFRAADEFRNINLASTHRSFGLLWPKVFGQEFPQEVYFPRISK